MNPMQISLFPDSTPDPVEAFKQRRVDLIESLGGWWGLQLADGFKLVCPGVSLWIAPKKVVGVYRLCDVRVNWNTANLHCFSLKRDEAEFGFSRALFKQPDLFASREMTIYQPKDLWVMEPFVSTSKPKANPQPLVETTTRRLRELIWEWMVKEFDHPVAREGLRIALADKDRMALNESLWFCHKQLGEFMQKVGQTFNQYDFEYNFWSLLEAAASCKAGCLSPQEPVNRFLSVVAATQSELLSNRSIRYGP